MQELVPSSVLACARSSTSASKPATRHAIAATLPTDSRIYVPKVYDDLTTSKLLVMEWLDGTSVRDVVWADGASPTG